MYVYIYIYIVYIYIYIYIYIHTHTQEVTKGIIRISVKKYTQIPTSDFDNYNTYIHIVRLPPDFPCSPRLIMPIFCLICPRSRCLLYTSNVVDISHHFPRLVFLILKCFPT